jgi:hypothetical protein
MYATDGTALIQFDSATPGMTTAPVSFTGLQNGETIVGIDLRPSNGLLYGIGSTSRIYTLNPLSGLAMQVGSAGAFTLDGTAFGTDFNPVPDRIRQVSDTEQNLRLNPNTGTALTDGALNPSGNVVAVAYSNNFAGATSATLYSIDSSSGTLGIITVPNSGGPITTVGSLMLGKGGLSDNIGFDISGLSGIAFASIDTAPIPRGDGANGSALYTINLGTGEATLVGAIGDGTVSYLGLTAATAVPEPSSIMLLGGAALVFGVYRRFRRAQS